MAIAEIQQPAPSGTALLIIDMINDLDFRAGSKMLPAAKQAGKAIVQLREDARAAGVPVVYVNDNYGQWHSERSLIVEHCAREEAPGRELVRMLEPAEDDFFVIKPQFSGFYSTNLPALLPRLGASRLIMTGLAADICVLFTAADAHMREYELWVPANCVASSDPRRTEWALDIMKQSMDADTRPSNAEALRWWLDKP
jgi:nicotinamidase-related amidase